MMLRGLLAIVLLWAVSLPAAYAHLMVAQRGTLNIVGNGAFMVISLPAAALAGTDDDGDSMLSANEFQTHRIKIVAAIQRHIQLKDSTGPLPLEGLMLTLSPDDETPNAPAPQIVAMGRFALSDASAPLEFHVGMFGKKTTEQSFQITVTRAQEKQLLVLSPERASKALFPSAWTVFADYIWLGAEHIFTGFDHMLFLLVVLVGGWGWRYVLLALTTFTLGHAVTLALGIWGGLSVSAAVVEPAIAATIVGMVAFDYFARRRSYVLSQFVRMGLVFGCALVHGMGLATALTTLGLDSQHQILSLAGFNAGLEIGQIAVALAIAALALGIRRLLGDAALAFTTRLATIPAVLIATGWFAERIVAWA